MSKFIAEVSINGNTAHHDGNFGKAQIDLLGINASSLDGAVKADFVDISSAQTVTGEKTLTNSLTLSWNGSTAPLRLPNTGTVNPTSIGNGDVWHRSNQLYARLGGTTRTIIHSGNPTTLASNISQAEAAAGTATSRRWFTALRVRQAILGWWNGSSDKSKLDGIETGAQVNSVTSVAGKTGVITLSTTDVSEGSNKYFTEQRAADAAVAIAIALG